MEEALAEMQEPFSVFGLFYENQAENRNVTRLRVTTCFYAELIFLYQRTVGPGSCSNVHPPCPSEEGNSQNAYLNLLPSYFAYSC